MITLTLIALLGCNTNGSPSNGASITLGDDTATTGDTDGNVGSLTEDDDDDGYCEAESCTDGSLPGDCDDGQPAVHPADEGQNDPPDDEDVDQNCDGIDGYWNSDYTDDDGDGFCESETSCEGGAEVGDCEDDDANTFPGAVEIYYNDNNEDCLNTDWDGDYDADGDDSEATVVGGDDCNDGDANVNPDMAEDNTNSTDDNCYGGTHNYATLSWTPNDDTVLTFRMFDDPNASMFMVVDSNGTSEYDVFTTQNDIGAETVEWSAGETEMEMMSPDTLTYVFLSDIENLTTGTTCVVWGENTADALALVEDIFDGSVTCAVSDPTLW